MSNSIYKEDFKSLDKFMALRFTEAGVPPATRHIQIFLMNQPITFGMKGSNYFVDCLTVLYYRVSSAVHAREFVYDLSAVGSSYQVH
jgi:hypothetical protein